MSARRFLRDEGGASAAEFAMVLPLLLLLLFGIIDAGRFMWAYNRGEKATQMGARYAAVTDIVAGGLRTVSFLGANTTYNLNQGDAIPAGALGTISCTGTSTSATCTCSGTCPSGVTSNPNPTAFKNIVDRMKAIKADIDYGNVVVEYSGSGIGYAGNPNGMEVSPLVSVKLQGLQFRPTLGLMIAKAALPSFRTTLTAEDLSGAKGYF